MERVRRRAWVGAAALALLFAAALLLASFNHTDDGCAVERHCTACVWALATAQPALPIVDVPPALTPTGRVQTPSAPAPDDSPVASCASRGPPAA